MLMICQPLWAYHLQSDYSNEVTFETTEPNQTITFEWDPATGDIDGTLLYLSQTSQSYTTPTASIDRPATTVSVTILTVGVYYAVAVFVRQDPLGGGKRNAGVSCSVVNMRTGVASGGFGVRD
jgi:hypothetical protein